VGLLRALWERLVAAGLHSDHPPGDDAVGALPGALAPVVARLRAGAPFGALAWDALTVDPHGDRVELTLRGPNGEEATAWVGRPTKSNRPAGPSVGYRVVSAFGTAPPVAGTTASPALVAGLQAFVKSLRSLPVKAGDY